jgi:hypothetical protein
MFYILFAAAIAVAVSANIYDVVLTERGIKAKLGVESWDEFVGEKPSALALYIRDFAFDVPFVALPLVCHLLGNDPLAYGTLVGPVVAGIKHVMGGMKWAKLLKK